MIQTGNRLNLPWTWLAGTALVAVYLVTFTTAAFAGPSSAPLAARPVHSYVALGDSFASGPGIPGQLGPETDPSAPSACLRSSNNYPALVARSLRLTLRDMSCAGASTEDLGRSQGPGIPPQMSALGPSTSIVSVGVAGNDLGFSSIAANCASATPWGGTRTGWTCASHYSAGRVDQLALAIHQAGTKVRASLDEIRARAPHARVYVIGYPDIVPPRGPGCWPRLPFSTHDVGYLNGVESELNATLARDAAAAGDVYVDIAGPSSSHNACTDDDTRWVVPIAISAGRYPLHPSASGMAAMAQIVEKAFSH